MFERKRLVTIFSILLGLVPNSRAQTPPPPQLNIFKNFFVTGDYLVAGWSKGVPDGTGFAPGTISVPDLLQPPQNGVPASVPKGADIVAAYLYWATVEGNQSTLAGQNGFFNGYAITASLLGNPNAPTSWSAGGCSGSTNGSKTIRNYRADVRPYLPLDSDPTSATFGSVIAAGSIPVRLADSGTNGNSAPFTLGATLVVVYRVLSPTVPLNSIVLYDGTVTPSNSTMSFSQQVMGFYQAAASPIAKITHIVGNGQPNKSQSVFLNTINLASLYPKLPPFPGIYNSNNSAWDNPTWVVGPDVKANDSTATTLVMPARTATGCVSWGAIVFSTTVQDTDGDGLLDVWETVAPGQTTPGYIDAVTNAFVALPGADPKVKDIFVEVDYLHNLDQNLGAGTYIHSHLPKQAALDMVGDAFAAQNIDVHFDVGPNFYQGDKYVITGGTGGNAIPESAVVCSDSTTLCQFPGQAVVGFKGDLLSARDNATLGNFQPGRQLSYHYVLFGHALGEEESFWSTAGTALSDPTVTQLVSITNNGSSAIVKIQTPQGFGILRPGDCPNAAFPACSDLNNGRVTIGGALGQPLLNGTYNFSQASSLPFTINNVSVTTTTFTITTANLPSGTTTYNFANEPQLSVSYLGPTSASGHSDFGGGGDSEVTFGLWGADDVPGCQPDPSVPAQTYCINQVGTITAEAGTLLHELGHTLTLTHGGTFYPTPNNPNGTVVSSSPLVGQQANNPPFFASAYGLNCNPGFLSSMNYLFQIRGFPDVLPDGSHPIGYSGQTFDPVDEKNLNESTGIGLGVDASGNSSSASHFTRWFGPPNAVDIQLQNIIGGRFATTHCDGTSVRRDAFGNILEPAAVRVDGNTLSAPINWDNNFIVPDSNEPVPWQDVNFNGSTSGSPDPPLLPAFNNMQGFNDWVNLDLLQIGARAGAFGFSGGGGAGKFGGGGAGKFGGGGTGKYGGGGAGKFGGGGTGKYGGGGSEQDTDTANSTVDSPVGLTCLHPITTNGVTVPACVNSSGSFVEKGKSVPLSWSSPGFGRIRTYYIWRANTTNGPISATNLPINIGKVQGTPPQTSFTDTFMLRSSTTYTYFVTAALGADSGQNNGNQSAPSNMITVTLKF